METNKPLLFAGIVNAFLAIIKIIAGILSSSSALIADGVHSISDLFTDVVAIIGNVISRRPPDKKHPFGHGKSEYFTSLIIGVVITIMAIGVIIGGMKSDFVIPGLIGLYISIFSIIIKIFVAKSLLVVGKKHKNSILIASGRESTADIISSIVVLISILLMQFSSDIEILKYTNLVATIIVGLFILRMGIIIIKDNVGDMLGSQEDNEEQIELIKKCFFSDPNIIKINEFHLLKYGPYYKLIAKVTMNENLNLKKVNKILNKIKKDIKKKEKKINYINIGIDV